MTRAIAQKWVGGISIAGSALPLIWVLGVFTFYLRARLHLGYWPQPSIHDPKLLPFEVHHLIFAVGVFPLLATVFIVPVTWFLRKKFFRMMLRREVISYGSGWILIASSFAIPNIKFVKWFLD